MMASRTITFGRVTFPFSVLEMNAHAVFASEQKIHIGTQYDFRISGTLAGATAAGLAARVRAIQVELSTPLRARDQGFNQPENAVAGATTFSIDQTGTTLFSIDATTCDDNDLSVMESAFTAFAGGKACKYHIVISCLKKDVWEAATSAKYDDTAGGPKWPNVLQISVGQSFDIDPSGLTTRATTGLVLTRLPQKDGQQADAFREQIVNMLAPPDGFRRGPQKYSCSMDGRRMDFSIVDIEMIDTFPPPITEGAAAYEVHATMNGMIQASLAGWFSCPYDQDQQAVIDYIMDLAIAKFGNAGMALVNEVSFKEDLFNSNRIDFAISVRIPRGSDLKDLGEDNKDLLNVKTFGLNTAKFLNLDVPLYPAGLGPLYVGPRGDAGLQDLFKRYIYDATVGKFELVGGYKSDGGSTPGFVADQASRASSTGSSSPITNTPDPSTTYLNYIEHVSYETKHNVRGYMILNSDADSPMLCVKIRPSEIYVIQAGSASRIGSTPQVSAPLYGPNSAGKLGIEVGRFQEPAAFKFDAAGNRYYSITWRYVFKVAYGTKGTTDAKMLLPANPRVKGDVESPWPPPTSIADPNLSGSAVASAAGNLIGKLQGNG
jgi:hypothetical protein